MLIKSDQVANILSEHITDSKFMARIGGDEFVIVLNNTNNCDVKKLYRYNRIANEDYNKKMIVS